MKAIELNKEEAYLCHYALLELASIRTGQAIERESKDCANDARQLRELADKISELFKL